ncbi:MAG TPA: hypothetical protein VH247_12990 [Thermoleophilaceae bacterium]|nr:hypothetical protein [Thermoleophilaceae bacterium]
MPSELLRVLTTATSGVVGTAFTVVAAWGGAPPEGSRTSPAEAAGFVVPLKGASGETIGLIAVEADEPLDPSEEERETIQLFAARAAAELERRQAEQELRAREAEVAASGARMVERADSERRGLGRELHDGAQQGWSCSASDWIWHAAPCTRTRR